MAIGGLPARTRNGPQIGSGAGTSTAWKFSSIRYAGSPLLFAAGGPVGSWKCSLKARTFRSPETERCSRPPTGDASPPEFFHHGERFLLRLRLRTPAPLAATQCPSVAQIPRGAGAFCQSDETRCRGGRRTPVSRSCRPGSRGGSPFRSRIATPIACPRAEAGAGSANPSWQAAPLVCEPLLIPPNLRGPRRSGRMRRP